MLVQDGADVGIPVSHNLLEAREVSQGVKIGIHTGPPQSVIAPLNGNAQPVKSLFSITAQRIGSGHHIGNICSLRLQFECVGNLITRSRRVSEPGCG